MATYGIYHNGEWYDEVYFQGHSIDQIYIGRQLVWEKGVETGEFIFEYSGVMYFSFRGEITCTFNNGYTWSGNSERGNIVECPDTATIAYLTGEITYLSFNGVNYPSSSRIALKKVITPFPKSMKSIVDFNEVFRQRHELTSIPENLFANCPNVTSFKKAFVACYTLTSIPENLFANCPNVTSFEDVFFNCGPTSVPENLFANCPNVITFKGAFYTCSRLTSIPENLFANCPNVTSFEEVFAACYTLTSIPENLFANCPNVTSFCSAFQFCRDLLSAPKLWLTHPDAYGRECYAECTKLPFYDEIPDDWK